MIILGHSYRAFTKLLALGTQKEEDEQYRMSTTGLQRARSRGGQRHGGADWYFFFNFFFFLLNRSWGSAVSGYIPHAVSARQTIWALCVSLYIIYRILIYTCLLSYLYMYCRVTKPKTKKRFPMLCHILSIQVCRFTCFMKCKHTIKKVQFLQFTQSTLGGGVTGRGRGDWKGKSRVVSGVWYSYKVCHFLSCLNCRIAAETSTSGVSAHLDLGWAAD